MGKDRNRRSGGGGEHEPNGSGPAPGVSARTDRLRPTKKREPSGAGFDGARRSIQRLGQLTDQLADAIARRDFLRARALAGSIESLRRNMAPTLANAARSGADPDALAALEADAQPLSDRLDTLIPQAPEVLPGLGVDLANPAADAGRETAWLASLGATRDDKRHGAEALAPRAGDPFLVARFVDAAQGDAPDTQPRGGAIDPEAASAQLGHASGTMHDEPLIEWRDVKHVALLGPFGTAPRDVQDVLTGPLVALLRKPETIHFLVDPTGGDPIKGGMADVIADLANDPAFTTGFAEGALTGTVRAVYDTIKGFYDTGKLIQEILVKLATFQHRELLAQGKKVIDDLVAAIKDAPGALEEFAKHWRAADSYTRGQFQGEVLGYILTQLAIIIAGSLTGGPAMAGPFANVIKILGWVDNPIAGLAELAAEARLSTTALETLRAGQGIRSIEPIAEARAASHAFGAFDDAADDLATPGRPMATADELAREASVTDRPAAATEAVEVATDAPATAAKLEESAPKLEELQPAAEATSAANGRAPRRANVTREGVVRNSSAEWRKIRDSWDAAEYGEILSPENRGRIARGRTPIVDASWVEWFPGDAALLGEQIQIHHIKGSPLVIPHPKSRHMDAHMPGGFKLNPGGPGRTGALTPKEDPHGARVA